MKRVSKNTLEKPTLESLAVEMRAAVERKAGKPGTPWEQVKTELELE
jgi:hypothetical protein